MGAEFIRGRVCQGPSLLGAEMSRNPGDLQVGNTSILVYYRSIDLKETDWST